MGDAGTLHFGHAFRKWPVGEIQEILASKDLTRSAPPAPACGLCLVRVTYPTDIWDEGNALVEE
jgi:tRNA U38,U39,U40 pseudouridine synthase TruA